jgi:succinate dehydrogenase hydrophobic anchor subunit
MILFSAGFFHWFLQRSTAVLLFFLISLSFFVQSFILISIFFIFLAIHLKLGIENLLNDYCHDKALKIFGTLLLRLLVLYILKYLLFVF